MINLIFLFGVPFARFRTNIRKFVCFAKFLNCCSLLLIRDENQTFWCSKVTYIPKRFACDRIPGAREGQIINNITFNTSGAWMDISCEIVVKMSSRRSKSIWNTRECFQCIPTCSIHHTVFSPALKMSLAGVKLGIGLDFLSDKRADMNFSSHVLSLTVFHLKMAIC